MTQTTMNRLFDETTMAMLSRLSRAERIKFIMDEAEREIWGCVSRYSV